MLEDYLYEQNTHWQNLPHEAGIDRELLHRIEGFTEIDQIITITGIRRCGKSYLLKQIINQLLKTGITADNILFVNLELPAFAGKACDEVLDVVWDTYKKLKNPSGRIYVLLDEIQTIGQWENWIRYKYDQNKGNIKFFLTGSNSQLLSGELATKLSGRVIETKLYPFSFREYLSYHDLPCEEAQHLVIHKQSIMHLFDEYLTTGAMPELLSISSKETKRELLSSYFSTIVFKDIVPRFSLRDAFLIQNLALYLMGNATGLLNLEKTAQYHHTNRNTVRNYIAYLEYAFLCFSLPKFDFSTKRQQLSQKKTYSIDNGFGHLLAFRFSPDRGKLLENLVFLSLLRQHDRLFYFRNQHECDFIIYQDPIEASAIQVCYELDSSNQKREVRGLRSAMKACNLNHGYILTYDQQTTISHESHDINVIPVWKWLLTTDGPTIFTPSEART